MSQNISAHIVPSAYVLPDEKPQNVAKHMIEHGQQQCFYIFDMDETYRRIQRFKNMLPMVQVYYAMNCNDSEMMLKLATASGLGFDCSSPCEIYRLRQLNVSLVNMIYSVPIKTPEDMKYARETGIKLTTFDSYCELKKLKENWPEARLLLSIRIDSHIVTNLNEKFECNFENESIDLLEETASLGLSVAGVAFQVDAKCTTMSTISSYLEGLKYAKVLFDHQAQAGRRMSIVDIGGGFPSDGDGRIDQVSKLINSAIEEWFSDPVVQIFAKPGRYFCDSSFTLYCSVSDVRRVKKGDKVVNMVYMNDGVYGTMKYSESWHKLSKFETNGNLSTMDLEETILWGPTCDCRDRVMKGSTVLLPRCSPLDWLVIRNHGAYTITLATKFSSLEIPLIRPVISSDLWLELKNSDAFTTKDFILYPDISNYVVLPSTLPSLPSKTCQYLETSILAI